MMGVGKTHLGELIAEALRLEFVDLDTKIELSESKSISNIFGENGENYFRQKEAQILRNVISECPLLLATGGGTPCFHQNMEFLLQNFTCVYLKPSPELLVKRLISDQKPRPLLNSYSDAAELKQFLQNLENARAPFYEKSHFIVAFDEMSEGTLVEKIIGLL